ncbi:MAG: PKD domain-containing protein [Chitinophagaceae bacterium]|nr:PKD domain-containing protein [Chitinophagaceae bacterium]
MNIERILTRKTLGLDHRVWRVMILLFVLSIGLFSYTLIDTKKCIPVDFKIKTIDNDSVFSTDEILSFSSLRFEKNITWDFGDNSPNGTGTFVTHRFAKEGKYFIKVTVNSDCQFVKPITVRKAIVESLTSTNREQIDGHPSTFVGAGETYTSLLSADTYEWSIENHPEYGLLNGQSVNYKFLSPGDFTIKLTLNKDRFKIYRKSVTVVENEKPKQVEKIDKLIDYDKLAKIDKEKSVKTAISDLTFKEYLGKVIAGDFFAKDFYDYLCMEGKTHVILNGKADKQVTFEQACAELNGKRRSKFLGLGKKAVHIKSVRLNKDKANCVTLIEIKYE